MTEIMLLLSLLGVLKFRPLIILKRVKIAWEGRKSLVGLFQRVEFILEVWLMLSRHLTLFSTLSIVVDEWKLGISLSAEYSECPSGKKGGDLGWFPRGKMAGPFQEVAFATQVGATSAPFKSTCTPLLDRGISLFWNTIARLEAKGCRLALCLKARMLGALIDSPISKRNCQLGYLVNHTLGFVIFRYP
ncbi:peptidyl-prolyl cis-trans isomerase NIMA-interacting 4 [Cucumis melo var. makuwa]|uniref:Peptidyl-prolyl cis-trans isomerase n=1 Tax=Cucumis melo var. makuwa TaxID=1194695 RepID=A0A5A7T9V2_CUCMM|nr:peptidyl-prolyl cis-trans isomerase NIMA-interacting 4 [Cucumis melo var. makuwa]TYJ96016.1 peptidyl-prolyl cis-trans isomerase NIMA-interacting 4 [Cucumis melo var. makuwa]